MFRFQNKIMFALSITCMVSDHFWPDTFMTQPFLMRHIFDPAHFWPCSCLIRSIFDLDNFSDYLLRWGPQIAPVWSKSWVKNGHVKNGLDQKCGIILISQLQLHCLWKDLFLHLYRDESNSLKVKYLSIQGHFCKKIRFIFIKLFIWKNAFFSRSLINDSDK